MNAQDFLLDYEEDFWHTNKDLVFASLVRGTTVLDIGCGDGKLLHMLQEKGKDVKGVELYESYLKAAQQRLKGKAKIMKLDASKEIIPGEYETVILSGVIEHIKNDVDFLRKISSNVKECGELLLLTSAYPWLYSVYDANIDHYRRYSKEGIISVLIQAGFQIESIYSWDAVGIPFLVFCKLFNTLPVSSKKMRNPFLNKILNLWFKLVENKMPFPFGLNYIVVARK